MYPNHVVGVDVALAKSHIGGSLEVGWLAELHTSRETPSTEIDGLSTPGVWSQRRRNHQVLTHVRHAISTFVFLVEMIMFVGRFWHITQVSVLRRRTLVISRLIPKSP